MLKRLVLKSKIFLSQVKGRRLRLDEETTAQFREVARLRGRLVIMESR